jgi:hypothetical protein
VSRRPARALDRFLRELPRRLSPEDLERIRALATDSSSGSLRYRYGIARPGIPASLGPDHAPLGLWLPVSSARVGVVGPKHARTEESSRRTSASPGIPGARRKVASQENSAFLPSACGA